MKPTVDQIDFSKQPTLIVAGLPRSGMTVTMQMLHAGGYPCAGEFPDFEPFWLGQIPWGQVRGKAVKLIDAHRFLPSGEFLVARPRRRLTEQARSHNKLMASIGGLNTDIKRLVQSYRHDYAKIDAWAARQIRCATIDFGQVCSHPRNVAKALCRLTKCQMDIDKMAAVVIDRDPECLPNLLEVDKGWMG